MARKAADKPVVPMTIETVPIDSILQDPANARRHPDRNLDTIKASLARFGQQTPIVVDAKGIIRKGNGTHQAAKALGWETIGIVRTSLRGAEATSYAIADNRTAELAEWDGTALAETLKALQSEDDEGIFEAAGFSEKELEEMLASLGDEMLAAEGFEDDEAPVDKAEELLDKWKVKPGDLWEIPSLTTPNKSHRLLCGDSTKPDHVARVMDGAKAPMMNTDPPYGVDYAASKQGIPRSGFRNIQETRGDIENDDLTDGAELQSFLEAMIRAAVPHLTPNPAFYLWHPMLTQGTFFAAAAAAADILIHRQIIWVKPNMVLTRSGMYHWKHELCFYGWIKGKPCEWYGDKSQVSVWEMGESSSGRLHPTQKPIELFARPMMNHTRPGEVVYEPFSGSGSQFVAAENAGRLCRGIEITPKFCSVVLERLEALGLRPSKVS